MSALDALFDAHATPPRLQGVLLAQLLGRLTAFTHQRTFLYGALLHPQAASRR